MAKDLEGTTEAKGPKHGRARARRRGPWRWLQDHLPAGTTRRGRAVRLTVNVLVVLFLLFFLQLAISLVGAWRSPGNSSFEAKWADWMRAHNGAAVVAVMENWYFNSKEPAKGGKPRSSDLVAIKPAVTLPPSGKGPTTTVHEVAHLPKPTDVVPVVATPFPGEGVWQPTGVQVQGANTMYETRFRADDVYTAEITYAVWIDTTLLRTVLHPGSTEVHGATVTLPLIAGSERDRVAAAFNGGFRQDNGDAKGGIYMDGLELRPLVNGAASVVIYKDGKVNVGVWGRDMTMSSSVESVLQNLTLMVDGGVMNPSIRHNDTSSWGATLKGSTVVARSGIGVDAHGGLIYVAGPALTARTLAESLQRAGAVRAMTLDINPSWVTFNYFDHPNPANLSVVVGRKLYPQMMKSSDRYLTKDDRVFFAVSVP